MIRRLPWDLEFLVAILQQFLFGGVGQELVDTTSFLPSEYDDAHRLVLNTRHLRNLAI
jgi:hypothetical protein